MKQFQVVSWLKTVLSLNRSNYQTKTFNTFKFQTFLTFRYQTTWNLLNIKKTLSWTWIGKNYRYDLIQLLIDSIALYLISCQKFLSFFMKTLGKVSSNIDEKWCFKKCLQKCPSLLIINLSPFKIKENACNIINMFSIISGTVFQLVCPIS